jgi:hypothetical protein
VKKACMSRGHLFCKWPPPSAPQRGQRRCGGFQFDERHLGDAESPTVRAEGWTLALACRKVIGRSPGARQPLARDTRCSAELEPASSPSRRMPTPGPPVGGQALSRRQPLIPVSHRSLPEWAAVSHEKCEAARGLDGLRDVPGLRGSCRSRQARSRADSLLVVAAARRAPSSAQSGESHDG